MSLSINKRKMSNFAWLCKIKWKVSVTLWNLIFHNSVSPNIKTNSLTLYCPSHTTKSALTSKDVNLCCSWHWTFALYPVGFVRWWIGVSFPSVILLRPVYCNHRSSEVTDLGSLSCFLSCSIMVFVEQWVTLSVRVSHWEWSGVQ